MHKIDVSKIDLNLLRVLQALLGAGSVTQAAHRLGIGQPAASHALRRLRELFADPLFVRVGRQVVPTPRAEALRLPIERLLGEVARLVEHEVEFDPARTTRAFTLVCPDLLAPLLPRLVAQLSRAAPHARLECALPRADDARGLEEGRIDLVLQALPQEGAGLLRKGLGSVHMAVVARRDHPLVRKGKLSLKAWTARPHVLVRTGHGGRSIVSGELVRASVKRRIGLVVPTFLSAVVAVEATELFFMAPRELLLPLLARFDLQLVPPPLSMPPIPVAAVWHERYGCDPAHRFFRELVQSSSLELLGRRPARPRSLTPRRGHRNRR